MRISVILALFVGYCAFSFSQELTFSRKFEASKKNLPLAIINNQPDYFYVLRYNKAAHDITVERRAKPSTEIISFTPLKLDSVNASWFDYQKLDYLFFEKNKTPCFLFEKVLNSKKTLYLKIIDTLFRSSGFIELTTLEKDKSAVDFSFEYKVTPDYNILIVASQIYQSTISKKVMLYDITKRSMLWTKKLPFENESTGYSTSFESDEEQNLFYICVKSRMMSYQRKYVNHSQLNVPVFFYDEVTLVNYLNSGPAAVNRLPLLANLSALSGVKILVTQQALNIQCYYALKRTEEEDPKIYFLNKKLDKTLTGKIYQNVAPLDSSLENRLSFYDGSDYKNPANKEYNFVAQVQKGDLTYSVIERVDPNYYKELVVWKADLLDGQIKKQFIIPRRVYGFKNKTRFKYGGEALPFIYKDKVCFVIAESPANSAKDPNAFNFKNFKVESNPWKANIMMYSIDQQDELSKTLVHRNSEFDMIPLRYQSGNVNDVVFYLTSGRFEKFAILQ